MSKTIKVLWFSAMSETIGLVLTDNGFEKRAYIKDVSGIDADADIEDIKQNGARIRLSEAEEIVNHLKQNNGK